jgi:hypothetical protein
MLFYLSSLGIEMEIEEPLVPIEAAPATENPPDVCLTFCSNNILVLSLKSVVVKIKKCYEDTI